MMMWLPSAMMSCVNHSPGLVGRLQILVELVEAAGLDRIAVGRVDLRLVALGEAGAECGAEIHAGIGAIHDLDFGLELAVLALFRHPEQVAGRALAPYDGCRLPSNGPAFGVFVGFPAGSRLFPSNIFIHLPGFSAAIRGSVRQRPAIHIERSFMAVIVAEIPSVTLVAANARPPPYRGIRMSELIDNRAHRVRTLKDIIRKLHAGQAPETVKGELRDIVQATDYTEIVAMEQELMADGMPVEEIRSMCDLHSQLTREVLVQLPARPVPPGHPIDTFRRENEAIREVVTRMRQAMQAIAALPDDVVPDKQLFNWRQAFNDLMDVEKHYQRKEHRLVSPAWRSTASPVRPK